MAPSCHPTTESCGGHLEKQERYGAVADQMFTAPPSSSSTSTIINTAASTESSVLAAAYNRDTAEAHLEQRMVFHAKIPTLDEIEMQSLGGHSGICSRRMWTAQN
jgi:hypothetical protein